MNSAITGRHLIAGHWVDAEQRFHSSPAHGPSYSFAAGTAAHIEAACTAAADAFPAFSSVSREGRAELLEAIAIEIDKRADAITEIGSQETGLPEARLIGERGRTTSQLRLFAAHIMSDSYLDRRHDQALPERRPQPRPDLRLLQRPIGPVAVFGASNFPLAFSVAGGDTASALAAGCPVVVKGHSAHPGTGEIVAQAVSAAISALNLHPGIFSLIQGGHRDVGTALVTNSLIKAVGFTGSLSGGRALFDLCASRPEPIPFFGELGSINPMFILPGALSDRTEEIAKGWSSSLTLGAGQFCTNPGVAVIIDSPQAEEFIRQTASHLSTITAQTMLTDGIAKAYNQGAAGIAANPSATTLIKKITSDRTAEPGLFEVTGKAWLEDTELHEEVFGPVGIIVRAKDAQEMLEIAEQLSGQLTATLHLDKYDYALAQRLIPILEQKAGRLLANNFPTGVEVCDAMVHGGPYPASTNFGATSVGTLSIRRWLRPVCYQNFPTELLPIDLT